MKYERQRSEVRNQRSVQKNKTELSTKVTKNTKKEVSVLLSQKPDAGYKPETLRAIVRVYGSVLI